jgi:hypothetical protein
MDNKYIYIDGNVYMLYNKSYTFLCKSYMFTIGGI